MSAIITGIKKGTSLITASFTDGDVTKTSSVTLTVNTAAGNVSYTTVGTVSVWCTASATAATSTDAAKTATVSTDGISSTSNSSGKKCTITGIKNSSGTSVSTTGWSLTTDGRTLTIPASLSHDENGYVVSIKADAPAVDNYYDEAYINTSVTVQVKQVYITSTSAVTWNDPGSITQKKYFPAGGCTLSTSTVSTYYSYPTASQTVSYNNNSTPRAGSISYAWSGSSTSITTMGTNPFDSGQDWTTSNSTYKLNQLTYTATGESDPSAGARTNTLSITSGHQAANTEGTTHYKNTSGTTGDNWTYGTPTNFVKSNDNITLHGGTSSMQATVTNTQQYYLLWSSGSYKSHTDYPSGTVAYAILSVSKNHGNGSVSEDYSLSGSTLTHYDIGTYIDNPDTVSVYAYNASDSTKNTSETTTLNWSLKNDRTKVLDGIKSYGTPTTITVSGTDSIAANGGSCTVTSSVTNVRYWHYEYTDTEHNEAVNTRYENEGGTVTWEITSETTAVSGDRWSALSATSGNSTKVTHSSMTTVIGQDKLTLTAKNSGDTSLTATKSWTISNYVTNVATSCGTFAYNTASAGDSSETLKTNNANSYTLTFKSGSTSNSNPGSTYGTLSTSAVFSIANTTTNGFTAINSSTGELTCTARGTTIGAARTSATVTKTYSVSWTPASGYDYASTGKISNSATQTATCTQNANYVSSISAITCGTIAYNTAAAGDSSETLKTNNTNSYTLTFASGSTGTSFSPSSYGTLSTSAVFSIANTTTNGFTAINSSTGELTCTARGTTFGDVRTSATVTKTYSVSFTPANSYDYGGTGTLSKSATQTATCTQEANYITTVTPSCGIFSYSNALAGDSSEAISTNNSNGYTLKFKSGSTQTSAPSTTYGSISTSVSYALSVSQNGFTAVNSSNGTLTCTARGTEIGASRKSGTVTKTYSVSWTPASGYDYASTGKISNSATQTATCTQNANYVSLITGSCGTIAYNTASAGDTSETLKTNNGNSYTLTFESGSTGTSFTPTAAGSISSSVSFALSASQNGFTTVNSSTGALTCSARGTEIGASRTSGTVTKTYSATFTPASGYDYGDTGVLTVSKTATGTCTQEANYVTAVNPTCGTIAYSQSVGAGTTSAALTTNNSNSYTLTFKSGSKDSSFTPTAAGSVTTSVSYSYSGSTNGFTSVNSSTGTLTCSARGTEIGAARTSGTVTKTYSVTFTPASGYDYGSTGALTKSATATATAKQNANYISSISAISCGAISYANALAGDSSEALNSNGGNSYTLTFASGSTSTSFTPAAAGTLSTSVSYALSGSQNGFTAVNSLNGTLTCTARGTTIGAARTSGTVTKTYSVTFTPASGYDYGSTGTLSNSASKTATCTQNANYVTAITASCGTFSYDNAGAGDSSEAIKSNNPNGYTLTFASTSTSTSAPSTTYGSISNSVTYSLASSQNGFTAVNSSNGTLTCTNRNTTVGDARTSAKVTKTYSVSWTPVSGYDYGSTGKISNSAAQTATCTQNANALESISLSLSASTIKYNETSTPTVVAYYTAHNDNSSTGYKTVGTATTETAGSTASITSGTTTVATVSNN